MPKCLNVHSALIKSIQRNISSIECLLKYNRNKGFLDCSSNCVYKLSNCLLCIWLPTDQSSTIYTLHLALGTWFQATVYQGRETLLWSYYRQYDFGLFCFCLFVCLFVCFNLRLATIKCHKANGRSSCQSR